MKKGLPEAFDPVLPVDFFSPVILNIEDIDDPVPQGGDPGKVDVTPMIRQGLSDLVKDSQPILPGDLDDGKKSES